MYRSGNDACVLKINEQFQRDFVIFRAVPDHQHVIPEGPAPPYFV
jgi:hypothetical protein